MDTLRTEIQELASRVISENAARGLKIALGESCTGGLVSALLTDIPGSSSVLESSLVTYSDKAKMQLLDVNPDLIETFGAVSIAVAWAMAQGVLDKTNADVAVSISGIAGPAGGSEHKPVGTVVFARALRGADPEDVYGERKNFDPEAGRETIRLEAAKCALELLLPLD